jgi:CheY-like chemotaxis protein
MLNVRLHNASMPPRDEPGESLAERRTGRFNVLLTEERPYPTEHWTRQLPRLMEPMGVKSYVARTGEEALQITTTCTIHAAVVDLATPRSAAGARSTAEPGGLWLLNVLSRQPNRPPVVIVNNRALTHAQVAKCLHQALRVGAFTVVNRPEHVESLLTVIRRVMDRHFGGAWPVSESVNPQNP